MDPITAGLVSGGIAAGGTLLSNIWSQGEAQQNRIFQRDMSNTAHQREVQDLRAAGLNPILSALGSGASTPGGSMPTINDIGPGISKGMDTAIALRGQNKELQMKDQQISNIASDTRNKEAQSSLIFNQSEVARQESQLKSFENRLMKETLPSMIKEAKVRGDWSQVNQIMMMMKAGTSSAKDIKDIINPFSGLFAPKKP